MAQHTILVYGTLRTGKGEKVKVKGDMYNLGWYPGIALGGENEFVAERLTGIDDAKLAAFDRYEGYNEEAPEQSLYIRRRLDNGDWIYEYNYEFDGNDRIESGDWLEHTGEASGSNAKLAEA